MALRVLYDTKDGEFEETITANYLTIEEAGQAAIGTAADIVKSGSRASIAAAGFGAKWQNTLRVDVFPKAGNRPSANAAAFIWHKIPYAGIFEEGGTIGGDPKLWLPLRGTPKKVGRHRVTPETLSAGIGRKLFLIKRPGKPPLLAAKVRATRRRAGAKVSLSLLRRGTDGKRGTIRTVPLFVGIDSVKIGKKFNITAIVERAAQQLPELYAAHLKVD